MKICYCNTYEAYFLTLENNRVLWLAQRQVGQIDYHRLCRYDTEINERRVET
jgi:hypothetical protein